MRIAVDAARAACRMRYRPNATRSDPLEPFNRAVFQVNEKIDQYVAIPLPLQGKGEDAVNSLMRFGYLQRRAPAGAGFAIESKGAQISSAADRSYLIDASIFLPHYFDARLNRRISKLTNRSMELR